MSTEPPNRGFIPVPDPTVLTAAAVNEAKEDLRREHDSLRELLEAKLAGITSEMAAHRAIDDEKFDAIQLQLHERDLRVDRGEQAAKDAVEAALTAAKQLADQLAVSNALATTKSESSFTKQIDQLYVLVDAKEKSQNNRIDEIKERIDRGEGGNQGRQAEITERRLSTGQAVAFATAALFAISIVVSIIIAFHGK